MNSSAPPSLIVGALVSLAGGALLSALGQLQSPLHLLTHEWSQGFAVIGLLVVSIAGVRTGRRHAPGVAIALTIAQGLLFGLGGLLTHLATNAAAYGCRTAGGPEFFWATWIPVALLAAVLGVALADRDRPWRALGGTLLVVVLACVVHDVGQALVGLRLVDPVLGELLAFDQRVDLDLPPVHLLQRGWLVAVAAVLWWGLWLRWDASPASLWRSRVGTAALVVGTLLGGSHIGLGWSRSALRGQLDAQLRTEHFDIRYRGGGAASLHVDAVAREAEWQLHRITTAWAIEPPDRIPLNLYDQAGELRKVAGASSARAGLNWIDLPWWDAFDDTLAHELVHAVHWTAWPNPLILSSRFHLEGTAVAWAEDLTVLREAHRETAGALRSGTLPHLSQLLSPTGFVDLPERVAYNASGSFIGFVVHEYGWDTLFAWQQGMRVGSAFDRSVDELDAQWRTFLEAVPVELAEVARSRERFDVSLWPSYRERRCPKLGRSTEARHAHADRLLKAGNPEGALALYTELLDTNPRPRWAHEAAQALNQLGRRDEARALLARHREGAPDDQSARLWDLERTLAMRDRDWPGVEEALLSRLALEPDNEELAILLEVLTQEVLREDVAAALLARRNEETGDRLFALLQAHPELSSLRRLALSRLVLASEPYRRVLSEADQSRILRFLELLPAVPEACDARRNQLERVAWQLVRGGNQGDAERIADALELHCEDPRARLTGARIRQRLAWDAP
ncbi:MAG: tetratricopeptide (TPR) repeat protein [Myxococcota bacterium]